MLLYRPTGQIELELVFGSDMRAWPPRLPDQPIFYPVLNRPYAREIALKWNTKSERLVGYVTEFEVEDDFCSRYDRQVVGGRQHEELWVPAEDLSNLNAHIVGRISVVDVFFGRGFQGRTPDTGPFKGRDAHEQLLDLQSGVVTAEDAVQRDATTVFVHYPRWTQLDPDGAWRQGILAEWAGRGPTGVELPEVASRSAA